ncbi:MAG: ATP-dependent DNA helicase RecG [Candidatus Curtissbacteria bacterium]|nr:ATP-dependent DNA helicase RecG [Candidatus Curtissbacteria bacterium]
MNPLTSVENLPGVGKYYSYKLKKLGIETVEDLIYHFPFRYEDFSKLETIQDVTPGEKISIVGNVWQIKNIRTRFGKFITTATVADESGTCEVIWFNQPYLTKTIKAGTPISLSGKAEIEGQHLKLISPSFEILHSSKSPIPTDSETLHTGRLVPIYPETEGVSSKWLRARIKSLLPLYLDAQKDFVPEQITKRHQLEDLETALSQIHFPKSYEDVEKARKRLSFDELFQLQFMSIKRRRDWQQMRKSPQLAVDRTQLKALIDSLPFKLTTAQEKAVEQITNDFKRTIPSNRLLEGDVGSGKTVVAAIAAFFALSNDFDVLFAAPTEILAFQHQRTLEEILSPHGVTVGIWTGSRKVKGQLTCGTHALLTTFKPNRQVGLVIVDEQHRFGVAQRAKLFLDQSKKVTPHLLTMTATPIPRTLSLTLYGDLDLTILDEMPKGRQKISTFVVPNFKRADAYKFIEKQVKEGRQVFILTPFVEPSETMETVKAATEEFKKLKTKFSKGIKLGLLHGRLKSKEKEEIINKFKKNKIHVLVTTPVVEVGIDVPNANVMMIESAERFGLAQLHQLRGRVGRGEHKSYCLLFTPSKGENSVKRLKSMEKVHAGFELAEIDLNMRGPGETFGLKQSGFTSLKIADITDREMIVIAQTEAKKLIEEDPDLKNNKAFTEKLKRIENEYVQPN